MKAGISIVGNVSVFKKGEGKLQEEMERFRIGTVVKYRSYTLHSGKIRKKPQGDDRQYRFKNTVMVPKSFILCGFFCKLI